MKFESKYDFISTIREYQTSSFAQFCMNQGVLSLLAEQPNEIHRHFGIEKATAQVLADLLVSSGLAVIVDKQIQLTPLGREIADDQFCKAAAQYHNKCAKAWFTEQRLGIGNHLHTQLAEKDENFFASYMAAMDAIAIESSALIRAKWNLEDSHEIVDVACGPASVTREWAKQWGKRVVGFDVPRSVEQLRELYGDRASIEFEPVDFWANRETEYPRAHGVYCGHFIEYCPAERLDDFFFRLSRFGVEGGKCTLVGFLRSDTCKDLQSLLFHALEVAVNGPFQVGLHREQEVLDSASKFAKKAELSRIPSGLTHSRSLITIEWR